MNHESLLRQDLVTVVYSYDMAHTFLKNIKTFDMLKEKDLPTILLNLSYANDNLDSVQDLFLKYNHFFFTLKEKFGVAIDSNTFLKLISEVKQETNQLVTMVSQGKLQIAGKMLDELLPKTDGLRDELSKFLPLPYVIDYSKLTNKDWKMIGIAGVHYRSKVFLSYYFRNNDPKKDENQLMIDYYIKPTIELLNITPVTARDCLKPQDLIDDKIMELVDDCDGIIGFHTNDDSIENIEHELSGSQNIIAVCREDRAHGPLMRRSRFQIDFKRNGMGDLLMGIIKALKESKLFNLSI